MLPAPGPDFLLCETVGLHPICATGDPSMVAVATQSPGNTDSLDVVSATEDTERGDVHDHSESSWRTHKDIRENRRVRSPTSTLRSDVNGAVQQLTGSARAASRSPAHHRRPWHVFVASLLVFSMDEVADILCEVPEGNFIRGTSHSRQGSLCLTRNHGASEFRTRRGPAAGKCSLLSRGLAVIISVGIWGVER